LLLAYSECHKLLNHEASQSNYCACLSAAGRKAEFMDSAFADFEILKFNSPQLVPNIIGMTFSDICQKAKTIVVLVVCDPSQLAIMACTMRMSQQHSGGGAMFCCVQAWNTSFRVAIEAQNLGLPWLNQAARLERFCLLHGSTTCFFFSWGWCRRLGLHHELAHPLWCPHMPDTGLYEFDASAADMAQHLVQQTPATHGSHIPL
jgi:hypothetical protein